MIVSAFAALSAGVARADHAPAYVVPGRSDVPVMINGYDASWGVTVGDWGSDSDIILSAVSRQQDLKGSQQCHMQGNTLALTQ